MRNASAAGTHDLLYDGNDLVAEYDAGGALLRRHVHGPGIDEPIVTYEGGQRRWLYPDVQGSIIALADGAGNVVAVNAYGPYGQPNQEQTGRFGLTGQAFIEGVPLYDFRARAYAPRLGRFLQTDPIGTDGGINLYEYAASDPVNNSDPDGTDPYGPPAPASPLLFSNSFRLNATSTSSGSRGGSTFRFGGSFPSLGNVGRDTGWRGIPYTTGRPAYTPAPTPQKPKFNIVKGRPPGAQTCSAYGMSFLAPPGFNIGKISAAGRSGGLSLSAINSAVGHYGTYDVQRSRDSSGNTTFYTQYQTAANVAVGAYMNGTGYPETISNAFSDIFAAFKSSNPGEGNQIMGQEIGWDAASGAAPFGCSGGGQ